MGRMVGAVAIQALHLIGEQILAGRGMLFVLEPFSGLNVALKAIVVRIWLAHGKGLWIRFGVVLVNVYHPGHLGFHRAKHFIGGVAYVALSVRDVFILEVNGSHALALWVAPVHHKPLHPAIG